MKYIKKMITKNLKILLSNFLYKLIIDEFAQITR